MNRTQLKVLWVGIGIVVLMGLFPPSTRGGYDFILQAQSVSLGRLIIEWAIVALITGGLIYTLKVDPDLMLKIASAFLCLGVGVLWLFHFFSRPQSYQEILNNAKKDKTNIIGFWVLVLVLLLLGLIAIRLSIPARPMTTRGGF